MNNLDFLRDQRGFYILTTEELNSVLLEPKLSDEIVGIVLDDKTIDHLSVGDILEKYEHFSKKQLMRIEKYILSHLNDHNLLFLSDLIDCANWNNIENDILFEFCLTTIKRRRSSPVVLSAILYVFEHMRIPQSNIVVPVLSRVVNNKTYYQDCQIIAAFCLFRITMNPKYLAYIKETIGLYGDMYEVLKNKMLLMDYNRSKRYFYYNSDDFYLATTNPTNQHGEYKKDD